MTYFHHLLSVVAALQDACPYLSDRRLSQVAGIGLGGVSALRRNRNATLTTADAILRAALDHAPAGPAGDRVRALAARLADAPPPDPDPDPDPEAGAAPAPAPVPAPPCPPVPARIQPPLAA